MNPRLSWCAFAGVALTLGLIVLLPGRQLGHGGLPQQPKPAPAQDNPDPKVQDANSLQRVLAERIDTKDFQEPQNFKTFLERLEKLLAARGLNLQVSVDSNAFKEDNPDAPDVWETLVKLPSVPRQVTVESALRTVLRSVITKNATAVACDDLFLITTFTRVGPDAKLGELVLADFDRKPLNAVLRELSRKYGVTIVLDNRVGDKANTKITARFVCETEMACVLRVIAEQAELKLTLLDGVILVTTPSHVAALRKERLKFSSPDMIMWPLWPGPLSTYPGFRGAAD